MCPFCTAKGCQEHDHLTITLKSKTYEQYRLTYNPQSIISKYGVPANAMPPVQARVPKSTDKQFRAIVFGVSK